MANGPTYLDILAWANLKNLLWIMPNKLNLFYTFEYF